MSDKRYYSLPGILGGEDHFDENGNLVGYSMPGIFGGTDHYNVDGSFAGYSMDGILGGTDTFLTTPDDDE